MTDRSASVADRGGAAATTSIGGLQLNNPILTASGTFGYGEEMARFFNVAALGGVVTKTVTLRPRAGNPTPRIAETPAGMLNSIGLQNVGVEAFVRDKLPYLAALDTVVVVSIMAATAAEFGELAGELRMEGVDALELNLSCPNATYGDDGRESAAAAGSGGRHAMFAHAAELTEAAVAAARAATDRPLIAKLGPDVPDIVALGAAAQRGGADALCVMNTMPGMVIDTAARRPALARAIGGLSGPAVRPIGVRLVYQLAAAQPLPVVGVGGISSTEDALQYLMAGARAVQVGSASFVRPTAAHEVLLGLHEYLRREETTVEELIGAAHRTGESSE